MIETLLKNIQNGTELRQNLSTLRKEIKDEWALEKCREQAHEIREYLEGLLEQEDAKTRKNAALLLGDLAFEESVDFYLESCAKAGHKPNKPYSGKVTLRLPPDLHARLAVEADANGSSLNNWLVTTLNQSGSHNHP